MQQLQYRAERAIKVLEDEGFGVKGVYCEVVAADRASGIECPRGETARRKGQSRNETEIWPGDCDSSERLTGKA